MVSCTLSPFTTDEVETVKVVKILAKAEKTLERVVKTLVKAVKVAMALRTLAKEERKTMTNRKEIERLVDIELAEANERYPLFHSPHEAYAVLLEEVEELEYEANWVKGLLDVMWREVKADEDILQTANDIHKRAVMLVQEAIQVAAMCKKVEMSKLIW